MSSVDQQEALTAARIAAGVEEAAVEPASGSATAAGDAASKKYASRDDILDAAGKVAEEEHEIEGIGWLLLSELSGEARAKVLGKMGMAIEDGKLVDPAWTSAYQRLVLLHGVVDPSSAAGARLPLFREGDMDRLMRLGGSKITEAVAVVERLSKMGRFQESAEGNSAAPPSGDSTSG